MRLEGKVCLITGAASGYGPELARRFAAEGAKLILGDPDEELGKDLADELGAQAVFAKTSVTSRMDVSNLVKTAVAEFDALDVVINNATYAHDNLPLDEVPEEEFDKVFKVNVKGLYHVAQSSLPFLKDSKQASILVIASATGIRPRTGLSWYASSKAAAISASKAMALELATDKIRVNAICPAAGETNMLAKFIGGESQELRQDMMDAIPLGRLANPADIAAAAVYLSSEEASLVTGVALEVDGGRCL